MSTIVQKVLMIISNVTYFLLYTPVAYCAERDSSYELIGQNVNKVTDDEQRCWVKIVLSFAIV